MIYYGRGTPAGIAGNQVPKWVQIDAEILTDPLRLRWQWPSGKIAIFKFKNGSLVCPDPFMGTWYEIILQKNR